MHVYTPGSPPPAASGELKNTKHPTAQHGDTGAGHGQPPERPRGSATCPRASTPASVPDTAFCGSVLAGCDRTSFGAALPPVAPSRCPGVLPSRHVRVAAALQAGRCYPRGTPDLHLLAPRQSRACPELRRKICEQAPKGRAACYTCGQQRCRVVQAAGPFPTRGALAAARLPMKPRRSIQALR